MRFAPFYFFRVAFFRLAIRRSTSALGTLRPEADRLAELITLRILFTHGGFHMLVLSRKKFESIVIHDLVTVTVVEIRGDKVRLGIEAPKEIGVHRQEVWLAIKAREAADDTSAV